MIVLGLIKLLQLQVTHKPQLCVLVLLLNTESDRLAPLLLLNRQSPFLDKTPLFIGMIHIGDDEYARIAYYYAMHTLVHTRMQCILCTHMSL